MSATREDVVRVARSYLETPWHHRGRLPGVGLDCAGILICAARELGLVDPAFDLPPYTMAADGSTFTEFCNQYMTPVDKDLMQAGDAIVLIVDREPQHLGILANYEHGGGLSIIHAASNLHPPRVVEQALMFSRIQRFASAYALPGIG